MGQNSAEYNRKKKKESENEISPETTKDILQSPQPPSSRGVVSHSAASKAGGDISNSALEIKGGPGKHSLGGKIPRARSHP